MQQFQSKAKSGFDYQSGHNKDFKKGNCGLSSLVLSVDGWLQGRVAIPDAFRQHIGHFVNSVTVR